MFKVGTGEHGTILGKIYLYATAEKESDGCWVYCKGKLYLRRACDDIGLLTIICPSTFKKIGMVKLCCEEAFKEPATVKYNKNMPLLTDGDCLFIVTMQVKTIKRKLRAEKQEEYEKMKKDEEEAKRKEAEKGKPPAKKTLSKDAKKEEKKQPPSDTAKICEFNLVEFDVNSQQDDGIKSADQQNEALIEELFVSFSGYFTKKECTYAMRINKNDIQNAAQWLVDEGENERGKIAISAKRSILLAQAVIKSDQEIDVVEESLLFPQNVTNGLWTMNKYQVTLHSSFTNAKIFSLNPNDVKVLRPDKILKSLMSLSESFENEDQPMLLRKTAALLEPRPERQQERFFEDVELRGSYIASPQMEFFQFDHSTLTYDNDSRKFYVLFLSDTTIGVALEYGDYGALNLSTLPATLKNLPSISSTSTNSLAYRLLAFLKKVEGLRFCLPWKWDSWDMLFSKIKEKFGSDSATQQALQAGQNKKMETKLMRLKQRQERFREAQEKEWIEKFNLSKNSEIPKVVNKSIKNPAIPVPRELMLQSNRTARAASNMFGIYKPDSLRSNAENLPDLPSLPRIPLAPYRGSSPKMIRGGPSYILDVVFYLNIIAF